VVVVVEEVSPALVLVLVLLCQERKLARLSPKFIMVLVGGKVPPEKAPGVALSYLVLGDAQFLFY
jgi:uncharacterized membrane protein